MRKIYLVQLHVIAQLSNFVCFCVARIVSADNQMSLFEESLTNCSSDIAWTPVTRTAPSVFIIILRI